MGTDGKINAEKHFKFCRLRRRNGVHLAFHDFDFLTLRSTALMAILMRYYRFRLSRVIRYEKRALEANVLTGADYLNYLGLYLQLHFFF